MENLLIKVKTKHQAEAIKAFAIAMKIEFEEADKFEEKAVYKMIEEGKKGGRMSKVEKDNFLNALGR
jgi:L-lactate utilization protein LutC